MGNTKIWEKEREKEKCELEVEGESSEGSEGVQIFELYTANEQKIGSTEKVKEKVRKAAMVMGQCEA